MTGPKRRTGTADKDHKGRIKAFEPTSGQRQLVENMAAYGLPQEHIRRLIPWDRPGGLPIGIGTFRKHFKAELERGQLGGDMKLRKRMFDMAMEGDRTMLIFLAKARLGMKETTVVEQVGRDGQALAMPIATLYLPSKDPSPEEQSAAIEGRGRREPERSAPPLSLDAPEAEAPPWRTDRGGDIAPEPQAIASLKPRDEHIDSRFRIEPGWKR